MLAETPRPLAGVITNPGKVRAESGAWHARPTSKSVNVNASARPDRDANVAIPLMAVCLRRPARAAPRVGALVEEGEPQTWERDPRRAKDRSSRSRRSRKPMWAARMASRPRCPPGERRDADT